MIAIIMLKSAASPKNKIMLFGVGFGCHLFINKNLNVGVFTISLVFFILNFIYWKKYIKNIDKILKKFKIYFMKIKIIKRNVFLII